MMPPTSIDGTDITGATIDGTDVTEITVDGDTVFSQFQDIIVDNYEASIYDNQNKSLSDIYNGDLNDFNRQSGTVLDGSTTLEGFRSGSTIKILSTSGLSNYPSQGDQIQILFRGSQNGYGAVFSFAVQANDDRYRVLFFDDLEIRLDDTGSTFASQSFSGNFVNETLRMVIDWHNGTDKAAGTIDVEVFDSNDVSVVNVSGIDTSYNSGGIGFGVGRAIFIDNFSVFYDAITITGEAGD